jgi:hypothetical protein
MRRPALACPITGSAAGRGRGSRLMVSATRRLWPGIVSLNLCSGEALWPAIAAVADDAREVGADLRPDLRDHDRGRVACPWVKPEGKAPGQPGGALAWAMNWPPPERWRVAAVETLTPNS